jgi:hypothetical protein
MLIIGSSGQCRVAPAPPDEACLGTRPLRGRRAPLRSVADTMTSCKVTSPDD